MNEGSDKMIKYDNKNDTATLGIKQRKIKISF
jgi:hypothetical protein